MMDGGALSGGEGRAVYENGGMDGGRTKREGAIFKGFGRQPENRQREPLSRDRPFSAVPAGETQRF